MRKRENMDILGYLSMTLKTGTRNKWGERRIPLILSHGFVKITHLLTRLALYGRQSSSYSTGNKKIGVGCAKYEIPTDIPITSGCLLITLQLCPLSLVYPTWWFYEPINRSGPVSLSGGVLPAQCPAQTHRGHLTSSDECMKFHSLSFQCLISANAPWTPLWARPCAEHFRDISPFNP